MINSISEIPIDLTISLCYIVCVKNQVKRFYVRQGQSKHKIFTRT